MEVGEGRKDVSQASAESAKAWAWAWTWTWTLDFGLGGAAEAEVLRSGDAQLPTYSKTLDNYKL